MKNIFLLMAACLFSVVGTEVAARTTTTFELGYEEYDFLACTQVSDVLSVQHLIDVDEEEAARKLFVFLQANGQCGWVTVVTTDREDFALHARQEAMDKSYAAIMTTNFGQWWLFVPLLERSWIFELEHGAARR